MAISISLKANSIYEYQAKIAEHQTMIAEQQAMPQIDIIQSQLFNSVEKKYTDDIIQINNEGGALKNFKYESAVFYKVNYTDRDGQYKTKEIPINDYYYYSGLTGKSKGLLVESGGGNNNQKYIDLKRQLIDYTKNNKKDAAIIFVEKYVKVSFNDILGNLHDEYYVLDIGKAIQMDASEGQDIFKKYNDSFKNGQSLYMNQLNLQELTKILWE